MTQVPLKSTDSLVVSDTVRHPLTDKPAWIKEIREVKYDNDRFDVYFHDAPAVFNKHAAALWSVIYFEKADEVGCSMCGKTGTHRVCDECFERTIRDEESGVSQ
jgi:hypothetical protein